MSLPASEKSREKHAPRYIVFVAGLAHNTTKEELIKHFEAACGPSTVRIITDKHTKKAKGFAFVEFENVQSMKNALRFHHTIFKKRKIRVELTAGGGGNKSETRRNRLRQKKEKLEKERQKYHETHVAPLKLQANTKDESHPLPQRQTELQQEQDRKKYNRPAKYVRRKVKIEEIKKPRNIKGANAIAVDNLRTFSSE